MLDVPIMELAFVNEGSPFLLEELYVGLGAEDFFLLVLIAFLSSPSMTGIELPPIIPADSSSACYSSPIKKLL
jgi:hypothetical protein